MTIPRTYKGWALVPNPGYEGKTPTPLEAVCHDGTPFLTVGCPKCGAENHIHESQIDGYQPTVIMALRCQTCMRRTDMRISFIQAAFAKLRETGWVA